MTDRTPDLEPNDNGILIIYLQPEESILDGKCEPAAIKKA